MRRALGVAACDCGSSLCSPNQSIGLSSQSAPTARPDRGWPTYGGDLANTRYSPLDQINAANFSELDVAWRFKTENFGPSPEYVLQSTPLVVNGVLYSTAGSRRAVVALDASNGELLWMYREDEGARGANAPRGSPGAGSPTGRAAASRASST